MAEKGKTEQPAAPAPASRMPPNFAWTAGTAVVLVVLAVGLFVAGFFTEALVNDDNGTSAVAQVTPPKATASPQPTALPVVAVTDGGDPSWGPADAKVMVVEFSDYQ